MAVSVQLGFAETVLINVKVTFVFTVAISKFIALFLWSMLEKYNSIQNLFCSDPDVDECKEKSACQCDGCSCKNTWGGYDCKCKGDLLYIKDQDTCIGKILRSNYERFLLVRNSK